MEQWRGRTALVTGASVGIGRAVAERLARGGMRVAVCARREAPLRELAAAVAPAELLVQPTDLRDEEQILALFHAIEARWGGVDVVVNNAGLGHHVTLTDGETERWRETLEVNVLALAICTRETLRSLRRRGVAGHVIHISSMSGHRVPGGSGMYAASKHAVVALTEALRQELRAEGSETRVSAISPGFVKTGFAEHYHGNEERARELYDRYPCLQPEDVAEAVRYVLSAPPHVQVHDVLLRPTAQVT